MTPAARTAALLLTAALALGGCRAGGPAGGSSSVDELADLEASVSAVAEELEQG